MLENVSKELMEKALGAGSKEEAMEILRQGGVDLTDEDLQNIAGGEEVEGICWTHETPCSWLCVFHNPDKCIHHCAVHCAAHCAEHLCYGDF